MCIRPRVQFLDAPAKPLTFTATVEAATGGGGVAAGMLGKTAMKVSLRLEDAQAGQRPALQLHVTDAKGAQTFVGGPVTRARDGCYEADVIASEPFARTRAALTRHLQGKRGDTLVAEGKLHIDAGTAIAQKSYAAKLVIDQHGQVRLDSPLFSNKRSVISSIGAGKTYRIGFAVNASYEQLVYLDFGVVTPPVTGAPSKQKELLIGKARLKYRPDK